MKEERKPIVIDVQNVSKTFTVHSKKGGTIRERVKNLFSGVKNEKNLVRALKDVSFEVKKGEYIGIVGHNGSGKSTLLKLIMGAYPCDKGGQITVEGKIIRLALGMGFDNTLSARDNIYVNGVVLGLTFRQIGERFQEIIEFAGLEDFVETPLKFYSSGMRKRLAFSIAMNTESDIFLLDEFFGGVGDASFMDKSDEVFKEKILQGSTIIHVSHTLGILKKLSDRVIWIDHGQIKKMGRPDEILPEYEKEHRKQRKLERERKRKRIR